MLIILHSLSYCIFWHKQSKFPLLYLPFLSLLLYILWGKIKCNSNIFGKTSYAYDVWLNLNFVILSPHDSSRPMINYLHVKRDCSTAVKKYFCLPRKAITFLDLKRWPGLTLSVLQTGSVVGKHLSKHEDDTPSSKHQGLQYMWWLLLLVFTINKVSFGCCYIRICNTMCHVYINIGNKQYITNLWCLTSWCDATHFSGYFHGNLKWGIGNNMCSIIRATNVLHW